MIRLAVICGNGDLPVQIIKNSIERCEFILAVFLKNQNVEKKNIISLLKNYNSHAILEIDFGEIGALLDTIKINFITHITCAGGVQRPSILQIRPDKKCKQWLMEIGRHFFLGDDGLLKSVLNLFEKENLIVMDPIFFVSDPLIQTGQIGFWPPKEQDLLDIQKGFQILDTLSSYDIGQAIIVESGSVLGIEAVEGTENLIKRVIAHKKLQNGGVLIKKTKINQDIRIDRPFIGVKTVKQAYAAGLSGIAVEAKGCIVLDKEEVIKVANKNNLFVWGG